MRTTLIILVLAALSACATPESRVRTALIDAGVSRSVSTCMAQQMVDRLSLAQLRRLSSLSDLRGRRIAELTVAELLRKTRELGDPQIVRVVTTAGIGCAIAS